MHITSLAYRRHCMCWIQRYSVAKLHRGTDNELCDPQNPRKSDCLGGFPLASYDADASFVYSIPYPFYKFLISCYCLTTNSDVWDPSIPIICMHIFKFLWEMRFNRHRRCPVPPLSSPLWIWKNLGFWKKFQQKIFCKKLCLWTYCELDLLIFVCFSYLNTMK